MSRLGTGVAKRQRGAEIGKRGRQLAAEERSRADDGGEHQAGNEGVFQGGDALLIAESITDELQQLDSPLFNKVIWADLPRVANPPATLSARGTRENFMAQWRVANQHLFCFRQAVLAIFTTPSVNAFERVEGNDVLPSALALSTA